MTVIRTVALDERIDITEQGRLDLVTAETCVCNPRLAGLLFECAECGTIFGSLRNSGPVYRASRGKLD